MTCCGVWNGLRNSIALLSTINMAVLVGLALTAQVVVVLAEEKMHGEETTNLTTSCTAVTILKHVLLFLAEPFCPAATPVERIDESSGDMSSKPQSAVGISVYTSSTFTTATATTEATSKAAVVEEVSERANTAGHSDGNGSGKGNQDSNGDGSTHAPGSSASVQASLSASVLAPASAPGLLSTVPPREQDTISNSLLPPISPLMLFLSLTHSKKNTCDFHRWIHTKACHLLQ